MRLILASASASRRQLLAAAGVTFDVLPSGLDEEALRTKLVVEGRHRKTDVALALACAKARAVARQFPDAVVIGADQTLLFEGELINKCADMGTARVLLQRLCGNHHSLIGGLAVARGAKVVWQHEAQVELWMRTFSEAFLDQYLSLEGEGLLATVGCYRLEGRGAQLFERIEGDYFSTLGLALLPLLAALRDQGVTVT